MREIAIDSYPIGPFFTSPMAAIAHAESYAPLVKAKADYQSVAGSQIIDASWTDEDFVIRFSNQKFLHVFVDPKERRRNVQWRILENEPTISGANFEKVGAPPVVLHFPQVDPYVMDRSSLIAARRGRDIIKFFVNEFSFYLYTPRRLILSFGSVYRLDNKENLLYVYEGD